MNPEESKLHQEKKGRTGVGDTYSDDPLKESNLPNDKGERGGLGSTYGGTQSPDPLDIDGYQAPADENATGSKELPPEELQPGKEYETEDSYGHQGAKENEEGSSDGTGETGSDADGTPIRYSKKSGSQ